MASFRPVPSHNLILCCYRHQKMNVKALATFRINSLAHAVRCQASAGAESMLGRFALMLNRKTSPAFCNWRVFYAEPVATSAENALGQRPGWYLWGGLNPPQWQEIST